MNITKNTESSSIVVQWDEVDDSLTTTYIVTWTSESDHSTGHVTLTEQSPYTITGLTLDTVYTITVTASNRCGQGPEYRTSVLLTADAISTTSSSTVTASANTVTIMSTSSLTTITAVMDTSSTPTNSVTTLVRNPGIANNATTTVSTNSTPITTTATVMNPRLSTSTANSITTPVGNTDATGTTVGTTTVKATTMSMSPAPIMTNIIVNPNDTAITTTIVVKTSYVTTTTTTTADIGVSSTTSGKLSSVYVGNMMINLFIKRRITLLKRVM